MKINLNQAIKFRPLEDAYRIYREDYHHWTGKYSELPLDSEGYASMELWEFMRLFGKEMYNGSQARIAYNNEIIFKDLPK